MKEIALNILDITRNSVRAGAKNIRMEVMESDQSNSLVVRIIDDGEGINKSMLGRIVDPFTTSRNTRKVGLGIPLIKYHVELTGGRFLIQSEAGRGTKIIAEFIKDHIDRQPLGDICGIFKLLLISEKKINFVYFHSTDKGKYEFTTEEARQVLDIDDLSQPEIATEIEALIRENLNDIGAEVQLKNDMPNIMK